MFLRSDLFVSSRGAWRGAAFGAAFASLAAFPAAADPIRHPTGVFAGLDKTTGRIINFDVAIDETVQFGTLQVTPRVCNTRPQTEAPQTTSFVEVDEQLAKPDQKRVQGVAVKTDAKPEAKRIFSGWMFAASPGLHGVEHPVYDVWLVDCKGGKETVAQEVGPAAIPLDGSDAKRESRGARKVEPAAPKAVEAQPIGPADEPVFNADAAAGDSGADAPAEPEKPKPKAKSKSKSKKRDAQPPAQSAPPPGGDPGLF
ncbi:MAG TPA: DUF2155 domain-containing protein [Methylocystis sp.]|jgi:hypothetical protein